MRTRYRSAFSWVKRGTAAGLLVLCASACSASPSPPPGCAVDRARAARVLDTLAGIADAEGLVTEGVEAHLCFASGVGTVWPGGVIALPSDLDDAPAAARLVHLAHHVRHGRGLVAHEPRGGRDCERLVDEALDDEAAAHVVEMQVRATLVLSPSRYANEREILALPRPSRAAAVRAFLDAHPGGGGGYEPLASDYRARCLAQP